MKWVCVIALVLDLLLVAAAAFRVMTVPKKDVAQVEDTLIGAMERMEAAHAEAMDELATKTEDGFSYDWGAGTEEDDAASGEAEGLNYKNIELNEETLENYDDQAEKGAKLDSATDKIKERFGSKKQ